MTGVRALRRARSGSCKILAAALLALPVQAVAQEVGDCDGWQASARNVHWPDPTRTFAEGRIRLVALDTEEPAAAAFHVMVLFPDPEIGYQECRLVSAAQGLGWGGVSLARATASYDPTRGLTVTVPGVDARGDAVSIEFTVNQATGEVTVP